MRKTRIALLTAVLLASSALSGCAYFQVGEEEFSCSGMPGSVYCHSARDVYESTNSGEVPSPVGKNGAYNEDCEDCVRSEDVVRDEDGEPAGTVKTAKGRHEANTGDEMIDNYVTPALPERPIPIRTPSQVMRIWIASYVDTNGDYVAPGYVYTEIEPRRWVLAKEYDKARTAFDPLEAAQVEVSGQAPAPAKKSYNSLERLERKQAAKRE